MYCGPENLRADGRMAGCIQDVPELIFQVDGYTQVKGSTNKQEEQ
jgi:hypothetical protein